MRLRSHLASSSAKAFRKTADLAIRRADRMLAGRHERELAAEDGMARYELVEGKSAKFWEIEVGGASVTTRWGRLGTAGQEKTKVFASPGKAQAECDGLIREKVGKGYRQVGEATPPRPAVKEESAEPSPALQPLAGLPASPPSPASPAPPEATPDGAYAIAWTDALRRKLHPRRGTGVRTVPLSPKAAFARMRAHWDLHAELWDKAPQGREPSLVAALAEVRRRFGGAPDAVPPPAGAEVEAATLAVLNHAHRLPFRQAGELHDEVVDFWVGTSGLAGAVRFLAASLDVIPAPLGIPRAVWLVHPDAPIPEAVLLSAFPGSAAARAIAEGQPRSIVGPLLATLARGVEQDLELQMGFSQGRLEGWLRLRRLLASAGEAEWQEARVEAATLREGAPLLRRAALSYLFPDVEEWAAEDAREALGLDPPPRYAGCLATCLSDAGLVDRMTAADPLSIVPRTGGRRDVAGFAFSLVEGLGAAAAPAIARLLDRRLEAAERKAAAEALAMVPAAEAATALAAHLDDKAAAGAAQLFAGRFPRLALPAFAAQLGRGPAGRIAESLLASIAGRYPDVAADLLPALAEPARRAVEAALARTAARDREAGPGELPPVLAIPPWTQRIPKPPRVAALAPLPYPESMAWEEGQRERWLAVRSAWSSWIGRRPPAEWEAQVLTGIFGQAGQALLGGESPGRLLQRVAELAPRLRWAFPSYLVYASAPLALTLWENAPPSSWSLQGERLEAFLAQHELAALPGLLRLAEAQPAAALELSLPFRSPRIAPRAADALVRLKSARAAARRWLLAHAECAAVALIPAAVGPPGPARQAGDGRAAHPRRPGPARRPSWPRRRATATRRGSAVGELLALEPLDLFPARLPKMPAFWQPAAFARPRLRDPWRGAASAAVLPLAAVEAPGHDARLLAARRALRRDRPGAGGVRPGVARGLRLGPVLRPGCTPARRPRRAGPSTRSACSATTSARGGSRRSSGSGRARAGTPAPSRASTCCAAIGTDVALMHLHGIAAEGEVQGAPGAGAGEDRRGRRAARAHGRGARRPPGARPRPRARRLDGPRLRPARVPRRLRRAPQAVRRGRRGQAARRPAEAGQGRRPGAGGRGAGRLEGAQEGRAGPSPRSRSCGWSWRCATAGAGREEVFRRFLAAHPLVRHLARRLVWGL